MYDLAMADPSVRVSPHCWKARFALAHKGLEADLVPWRFHQRGSAESGTATVPYLFDGDQLISDSWRIAVYLESCFPERPSHFGSPDAVPLARMINSWIDLTVMPLLGRVVIPDVFEALDPLDQPYFREARQKRFGITFEDLRAERESWSLKFLDSLAPLRRQLSDNPFVSGTAPGYADYCVMGAFMFARCTGNSNLISRADASVVAWNDRMLGLFGGLGRSAPVVI
ncbi:glutathione S-transferase N-terminal domain-containing protein [Panacagrimonas perspica]|uniref:glutathione S-transferase N-terminal domain-containing protein n=1 Tax=Panacagrimonas perspica TaxID=381431 RepID=UPI001B87286A|nr:glutathione S-transferase N-terminal domain-containing protein [Panacagrimonas perspica]